MEDLNISIQTRDKVIENHKIDTLVDMGWHAFGNPSYPSVAFTLKKDSI